MAAPADQITGHTSSQGGATDGVLSVGAGMMTGMQASEDVLTLAGGAYNASLNHYGVGGNCLVTTVQVDDTVFVVGQDDFRIGRYTLDEWLGVDGLDEVPMIEADDAEQAWDMLQLLREDTMVWQCGGCDAWIFTSNRPRVGILQCSTCGDGGIDFRHADRHVGKDD